MVWAISYKLKTTDTKCECFTTKGVLPNRKMWKIVEIRKSQFFNFFSLKCEKTLKKHLKTWKGNNLVKKKKLDL